MSRHKLDGSSWSLIPIGTNPNVSSVRLATEVYA